MRNHSPLNIIWHRQTLDHVLEGNFIHNILLSEIKRPLRHLIYDESSNFPYIDDCLIVSLYDEAHDLLIETAKRGAKNVGLLQMGDEYGQMPQTYLNHVDYVFRNYFFESYLSPAAENRCFAIEWVPNGNANGVAGPRIENSLTFQDRPLTMFFSGFLGKPDQLIPERDEMVNVIRDSKLPATLLGTEGFAGGLGPATFSSYLNNSKFALCPAGNSPETIRFYDAIECGSIPICLKSEYLFHEKALNGAPVVILDKWNDLPDFINQVTNTSPDLYEQARIELYNWWREFKLSKAKKIATIIDQSFLKTQKQE
ncbi:MAG: hypothetical protein R3261_00815 [Alphaproteobacteria bacterium]|nr:hypothetical protein [Alphaproteobacteria bacterium]